MSIISRGLGYLQKLITRGYGVSSISVTVEITGIPINIDIRNVKVAISNPISGAQGGGPKEQVFKNYRDICNVKKKVKGIKLSLKIGSVKICSVSEDEEEILNAIIQSDSLSAIVKPIGNEEDEILAIIQSDEAANINNQNTIEDNEEEIINMIMQILDSDDKCAIQKNDIDDMQTILSILQNSKL